MFSFANVSAFLADTINMLGPPWHMLVISLAIGAAFGRGRGIRFFIGFGAGLALTALISAIGAMIGRDALLLSPFFVLLFGVAGIFMLIAAVVYLGLLAYEIASAPQGQIIDLDTVTIPSVGTGLVIGLLNPKAFVAFTTMFSTHFIMPSMVLDIFVKLMICIALMIGSSFLFFWLGSMIFRLEFEADDRIMVNKIFAAFVAVSGGLFLYQIGTIPMFSRYIAPTLG